MNKKKILIVDDEFDLASQLAENLNYAGHVAEFITNPELVFEKIESFAPDIIVLDKMMPQRNGIDVLRDIRSSKHYSTLPAIMLTACNTKLDLIQSFDNGIDDFLAKPFDFEELKARVNAVCNRTSRTSKLLEFEDISLCTRSCLVKVNSVEVTLTLTEFNILKTLMSNLNEVLNRTELCREVLGKAYSSSRTIDVHMLSLRKKLKDKSKLIKTVRGVGYKICA